MKHSVKPITLSLLLSVVVLSVIVLSALTFSTASADKRLAEKYSDNITETYRLESDANLWLSQFDEKLQRGLITESEINYIIGEEQSKHLQIKLSVNLSDKTYTVKQWCLTAPPVGETTLYNLWNGE